MDTMQERASASVVARIIRWLGDLERANEMRAADHLEMRVAQLERATPGLREDASAQNIPPRNARES